MPAPSDNDISTPIVRAVNFVDHFAVLDDGQILPVTNWIDRDGDESDPDDAITCVIGPTLEGDWLVVALDDFERGWVQ